MDKWKEKIESHKIMSMDEEKRMRIINAGITEFVKGYERASTDTIVKNAGISKGLLFHYFGTKEKFYVFLNYYTIHILIREFFSHPVCEASDILQRYHELILVKLKMTKKYVDIFDFLKVAHIDEQNSIPAEAKAAYKNAIKQSYEQFYKDIDYSLFREDINIEEAMQMITWTFQGVGETEAQKYKNDPKYRSRFGQSINEMEKYAKLLRKLLYK